MEVTICDQEVSQPENGMKDNEAESTAEKPE
jgi:hypothetical protein